MVILHIAAIVYYLVRKNSNLLGPMIDGDKPLPPGTPVSIDSGATRLVALAIMAGAAALVAAVVRLGG
jgi:hypothetical protein